MMDKTLVAVGLIKWEVEVMTWTSKAPTSSCGGLRVGVDLVEVADVAASLDSFGDRYKGRLFTAVERAECEVGDSADGDPRGAAQRYAARFAAKESVIKVLRPAGAPLDWRSIQTRGEPYGALTVSLVESAADLAQVQGIRDLEISVTHEGSYAAAVAVAHCGAEKPARDWGERWRTVSARFWRTGRD